MSQSVLLVHGMGRTPTAMLWPAFTLWKSGQRPALFGYVPTFESFERISDRLVRRMTLLAAGGPYFVVGHSLGGLLLRAAVARLPEQVAKPSALVQLATPNRSPRLAQRAARSVVYRALFGDCARLLASPERMQALPLPRVPLVMVVGTSGFKGRRSPFGGELNDTVIARSEAQLLEAPAGVEAEVIEWPLQHTFIMNSRRVRALLLEIAAGARDTTSVGIRAATGSAADATGHPGSSLANRASDEDILAG